MKHNISILGRLTSLTSLLLLCSLSLHSQPSASNQIVTLKVLELNKVSLSNEVTVYGPVAYRDGRSEWPALSGQTRLVWTSNGALRKISVASRQASMSCIVRLDLQEIRGTDATSPRIELADTSTHDFIKGLPRSAGSCQVRFFVIAADPQELQSGIHSIVYTVTNI